MINKYSEAPMSPAVKEELLGTRAAKSRTALAAFLAAQPALSYNSTLRALRAAPKGNSAEGEYLLGQEDAKRLLGKE
jgi:hypothetical protein